MSGGVGHDPALVRRMRKLTAKFERYVTHAQRYAWDRWLLDDPAMVRDWCSQSWQHYPRHADLVDAYARKYDLTDPRDLSF